MEKLTPKQGQKMGLLTDATVIAATALTATVNPAAASAAILPA